MHTRYTVPGVSYALNPTWFYIHAVIRYLLFLYVLQEERTLGAGWTPLHRSCRRLPQPRGQHGPRQKSLWSSRCYDGRCVWKSVVHGDSNEADQALRSHMEDPHGSANVEMGVCCSRGRHRSVALEFMLRSILEVYRCKVLPTKYLEYDAGNWSHLCFSCHNCREGESL